MTYEVGDLVEVNVAALRHRAGVAVRGATGTDPSRAPAWAPAVVERVRTFPGYAGFERYTVRIRAGELAGATAEAGVSLLRPPPQH